MIDLNQIEFRIRGAFKLDKSAKDGKRYVFFFKPSCGEGTFYYYFAWGYWIIMYHKHFDKLPKARYIGQPLYERGNQKHI